MVQIATTRVRPEWVNSIFQTYGTLTRIAEKLGVDKSTASRWMKGDLEASPRFVGSVLTTFAVDFDDAFVCTIEEAEQRRTRIIKRPNGKPVAA